MITEKECPMCGNNIFFSTSDTEKCSVCGYDNSQQQKTHYTLTITAPSHGTISGASSGDKYPNNKTIKLTAVPAEGYHFTTWTFSEIVKPNPTPSLAVNPAELSIRGNYTVAATFAAD